MTSASPKIRRLQSEHADMLALAKVSSFVEFAAHGSPPTRYEVNFSCFGLARSGNALIRVSYHELDLILSNEFPLEQPKIVWRTPIFHPNMKPPDVCTGDIWYPGSSVAELCTALCEMVQFKTFNIYHPLDLEAAAWLLAYLQTDHPDIPIDPRPIRDLEFELAPEPVPPPPD